MRIIAHMAVGPGETDRFLAAVLTRVNDWADVIHVGLDRMATGDDEITARSLSTYTTRSPLTFVEHEGRFRESIWHQMEDAVVPELGDRKSVV